MRVSNPPSKPLLIFDGDCHFCRRWIERWRGLTGEAVAYAPSQEVSFPEIPAEQFQKSVVLVLPGGETHVGADAVYRSLAFAPNRGWPLALYQRSRWFATLSEAAYRTVSRHRGVVSFFSRTFWGDDVRAPRYVLTRDIFLRLLGLVYFIAFASLWLQIDGLIGARGILPVGEFLRAVKAADGARAFQFLPTLCWFGSSNTALHLFCGSGAVAALALIFGFAPIAALGWCFASYLSLTLAGQDFLSFQWDILLLEAGFLALFFAPWRWTLRRRKHERVPAIGLFLLKLLLFKLMFMSGVVKLTAGDDCWWNLTALDYHYWTQPLPTPLAWSAAQDPEWFRKFSVGFCLAVEIVVPFFIWGPRRLRLAAAGLLLILQGAIALTGNYGFFNLLTVALCFLLIDDASWRRLIRSKNVGAEGVTSPSRWARIPAVIVLVLTLPFNLWLCYQSIHPGSRLPSGMGAVYDRMESFRIVNGYGLFRQMTRERPELEVEGSAAGVDWKSYVFKFKAGDVRSAPRWVAPDQPRLDWQMWFAALGRPEHEFWFQQFLKKLLLNEPAVTNLLAQNPFAKGAPRYVRVRAFSYRFTAAAEKRATGAWWKRQEEGEYLTAISLENFRAGGP